MSKELNTWKDIIQALLDGERVEYLGVVFGRWVELTTLPSPHITDLLTTTPTTRYRIKPRTIKIGGIEVPEPVKDENALGEGEDYFLPNLHHERLYSIYTWSDDNIGLLMLKRGLVHKTEEAAILHAKALIKISGGGYES